MRDGFLPFTETDTPEGGVTTGVFLTSLVAAEREAHDRYRRARGEPSARSAHWAWVKAKAALAAAGG